MMYYGNEYGWGYGPVDALSHVLWFIVIVVLIMFALRLIMGRPRRWRHFVGNSALDILAERYAKGEISKEEYEERKNVLSH